MEHEVAQQRVGGGLSTRRACSEVPAGDMKHDNISFIYIYMLNSPAMSYASVFVRALAV
jgi:hypothetical protein